MSEETEVVAEKHPLYDAVWNELTTVIDPEIGLALTELGLVYELTINEENVASVKMTLTSMACPAGPELQAGIHAAASRVHGIQDAEVEVVWSPPWDPREMASEEAQMHLGIF